MYYNIFKFVVDFLGDFKFLSKAEPHWNTPGYLRKVFIYPLVLLFKKIKFFTIRYYQKPQFILSCIGIGIFAYVFTPSLLFFNNDRKGIKNISKRPDKLTTGFTNTGNDCFANSTIQSFVPLYQLNHYFNQMLTYPFPELTARYQMPLHLIMMQNLNRLQKTVYYNDSLSVWNILHLVENIYQGKISRSQNDAHELFQLLLETLEDEYNRVFSFISNLDEKFKNEINLVPHFPFSSVDESTIRCMKCHQISAPVQSAMKILELNVPETTKNTSLDTMIRDSRSEIIEGYNCFVCMAKQIIFSLSTKNLTKEHSDFVQVLQTKLATGDIKINDELNEDPIFKSIITSYEFLQHNNLKSTIHREVKFVKPPEILPIHLSRSIFADSQTWRNSCNVEFPEQIEFLTTESIIPVEYSLRSVIRHQGTHSSGHYECYRKKPQFYKKSTGQYYNDIPDLGLPSNLTKEAEAENITDKYTEPEMMETYETEDVKKKKKTRRKKLASVLSKPFWRISDTKVTEVARNTLHADGKAVYMLIYERKN